MKKIFLYLLPAAITFLIVLLLFFIYGLYPMGNNSLAWCDMKQQVVPILLDLKNILNGIDGWFLNLGNAGGMSFLGVFFFFVASPFSFLIYFFPTSEVYHFVNLLVLLKMCTCSFTAGIFFYKRFPKLSIAQVNILSVLYAFSGYTLLYFQNVIWLDMAYLFPVLLLGFFRLVEQKKVGLYIIALSAIIVVHFYLSYMVILFLIFSFGLYLFFCVSYGKRGEMVVYFGISSIICIFLTSIVLLPCLFQYLDSARTASLFESLSKGKFFTYLCTTLPILLCSPPIFGAFPIFWKEKRLSKKSYWYFSVFLLTSIPLIIEPINKMWHTGSYQAFPSRYGFIPIFFALIILAEAFSVIQSKKHCQVLIKTQAVLPIFVLVLLTGVIGIWLLKYKFVEMTSYLRTLWISSTSLKYLLYFLIPSIFCCILVMIFYHKRFFTQIIATILIGTSVLYTCLFTGSVFIGSASKTDIFYQPILDLSGKIQEEGIYRVKNDKKYFDVNLVGAMGYATLNHYTSLISKDYLYCLKKLGYSSYWMEVNSSGGTILTDAILANKYIITTRESEALSDEILYQNPLFSLKKNPIILPFGFSISLSDISELSYLEGDSRMDIQEDLFQKLFSSNESFVEEYDPIYTQNIELWTGEQTTITNLGYEQNGVLFYEFNVEEKQTLYFDCFHEISTNLRETIYNSFNIYVNGKLCESYYPSQKNNGLLELGTFENEKVSVTIEVLKDVTAKSFGVFGMKWEPLLENISQVQSADLFKKGNKIEGTITVTGKEQYLFLPLPYDDGYKVKINGVETEIYRVFDNFMLIKLSDGENHISLSYIPEGFVLGMIFSVVGIFLLSLLYRYRHKVKIKLLITLKKPFCILYAGLLSTTFLLIYIFPIIVYLVSKIT